MTQLVHESDAAAVAQVSTGVIGGLDATPANNSFTVTIGGIAITVPGDSTIHPPRLNLAMDIAMDFNPTG